MTAGPPQAEILMGIFMSGYQCVLSPDGTPYAYAHDAPCVAIRLKSERGPSLRKRLAKDMFRLTGKLPSQEALASVIAMVDGICQDAVVHPAALRSARRRGDAVLDLGLADGLAAVISPGSWQLSNRAPVLFRRTGLTWPLPVPSGPGDGSLDDARHLVNIPAGGEWEAYVACRVCALLYPQATHPAEIFGSDTSGSLKTATVRLTKGWADPGPMIPPPKDSRSWAATASSVYNAAMDNVSFVPDWWSDLLCKGSSGDSWADRALYTDNEAFSVQFSVVPLLDGIGLVSVRADLADRAIRHHLTRPRYYLGDDEAADAWEKAHPAALGWLLDQSAQVARMHAYARVQRPRSGRMSVYEWTLAAIDALWNTGGTGMAWWKGSQHSVAADAVAGDVVASAIQDRISQPFTGTAGTLAGVIWAALAPEKGELWTAQKLGRRMPRAVDALSKLGWHLERQPEDRHRQRPWLICPPGTWEMRDDGTVVPLSPAAAVTATQPGPAPAASPLDGRTTSSGDLILPYRQPDGTTFWPRAGDTAPLNGQGQADAAREAVLGMLGRGVSQAQIATVLHRAHPESDFGACGDFVAKVAFWQRQQGG